MRALLSSIRTKSKIQGQIEEAGNYPQIGVPEGIAAMKITTRLDHIMIEAMIVITMILEKEEGIGIESHPMCIDHENIKLFYK